MQLRIIACQLRLLCNCATATAADSVVQQRSRATATKIISVRSRHFSSAACYQKSWATSTKD